MEIDSLLLIVSNLVIAVWCMSVLSALGSVSWGRIKKLDPQKKKRLIQRAEHWLENRETYRILIRFVVLTNLAIVAAHTYSWSRDADYFITNSVPSLILCSIVVTVLFVLATEVFGTGWLGRYQWALLSFSHPLLRVLFLFSPLALLAVHLRRHFDVRYDILDDDEQATTADEIISLVEQDAHESGENGDLEATERQMIRGIFDLDETLVKEIMTPRVDLDAVKIPSTVAELKKTILACGHSRIPAYRDRIDDIVGIIYAKDLLDDEKLNGDDSVEPIMHSPVFVPETKNVGDLLEEFKQNKIHIAIIIDEYGGTAGVVTIEDILEEIVGEIRDEYDAEEEDEIQHHPDGSMIVDARTPIDKVNELLDLAISENEDYDTIGGYVISEVGRIPSPKETFQLDEIEVEIIDSDARKVSRIRLVKKQLETEQDKKETVIS